MQRKNKANPENKFYYFNDVEALFNASEQGNIREIKRCLSRGILVNSPDHTGLTPLHYAILGKSLPAMHLLIEEGACVDAADETGLTPLHLAIIKGNREAIELLIESGASIEAVDHIGYSALLFANLQGGLPYEETEELLVKNSPKSLLYKHEFLHRKLLAHAFASQATHDLILFKTKNQIVKTIAGFPPGDYFLAKIHESLACFFEEHSDQLSPATKELLLTASELNQNHSPETTAQELYQKWRIGKPILIATGFIWHHVSVCIWEDHFIIANRGNGNEGKRIRLAKFNSSLMSESIIEAIQDLEKNEIDDYLEYMHDQLPEELQFFQPTLESALEECLNQTILPQEAPNCAWANRQGALKALLQLHLLKEENISCGKECKANFYECLQKAEQMFSAISTFQKCLFIEKYLDLQENPEHPHYPSPQLLSDAVNALKVGESANFPELKRKLKSTLNRLERFFEKLQTYPTQSMDSDVHSIWVSELAVIPPYTL